MIPKNPEWTFFRNLRHRVNVDEQGFFISTRIMTGPMSSEPHKVRLDNQLRVITSSQQLASLPSPRN